MLYSHKFIGNVLEYNNEVRPECHHRDVKILFPAIQHPLVAPK